MNKLCQNCLSSEIIQELCKECGGNRDTGVPLELMCDKCKGTERTGRLICEDCEELVILTK